MPHEGVVGIIFDSTHTSVLSIKRTDIPIWVLPGGGIDPGETPEEAVIREVFEETGLQVEIARKSGEYTPLNKLAALTHVFECREISGRLTCGQETKALAFFPIDQLPPPFFPVHQEWIADAVESSNTVYKPITQLTPARILKFFIRHPWVIVKYLYCRFLY